MVTTLRPAIESTQRPERLALPGYDRLGNRLQCFTAMSWSPFGWMVVGAVLALIAMEVI